MLAPGEVSKIDKRDVLGIVSSLPEQMVFGLDQGSTCNLPSDLRRIFVVGMGGSAIAADVFAAWTMDKRATDIQVIRDYRLPAFACEGDAVIAVSYSGNTEETLSAASQAVGIGCKLIGVCSGGELAKFCRENRAELVKVPHGYPPRGAFGYLFGAVSGLCRSVIMANIDKEIKKAANHLEEGRKSLGPDKSTKVNRAKSIALKVYGKTPIIYGSMAYAPIARRWQTEFNENAKILAWASCFPEADHNEIEGWGGSQLAGRFLPIFLRDRDESEGLRHRLDATKAIIGRRAKPIDVQSDGDSLLSRMLGTLLLGDLASVYLAVLRKIDPYPVASIEALKARLKSKGGASRT
jgi:glucose/mannose-6-phosphate isomerase